MTTARPERALPRNVIIIGLVSLLNDFASEMVVPLIPLLLATTLATGPAVLGLIEGLADAVSNLIKLWAGRSSDRRGGGRKPYVVGGYFLSNLVRPAIGLSGHWLMVLGIRVTDRVGKGLRTAPRDALIADSVHDGNAGRAYGYSRALDHIGAVLGALTAAAVLSWGTDRLDIVIAWSALPGMLAVALFAFGVSEVRSAGAPKPLAPLRWSGLGPGARPYLACVTLFACGRIPETFLLLRGHELGLGVVALLLLWAAMHGAKSLIAEAGGRLADRLGRRPVILGGWALYVVAMLGLALTDNSSSLWALSFVLAGYYGLSEGAERALVRDLAGRQERGTVFGWYHMLTGLAAVPAGVGLGTIWMLYGAAPAFLASAAMAVAAGLQLWRVDLAVSRRPPDRAAP